QVPTVVGDMAVRIWDAKEGKLLKELKGHTAPVMAVAFGPNNLVLTGGIDKAARLWDVSKDAPIHTFPANKSAISAVAVRADGKQCLIGAGGGVVRVFDLAASPPHELARVLGHPAGAGA